MKNGVFANQTHSRWYCMEGQIWLYFSAFTTASNLTRTSAPLAEVAQTKPTLLLQVAVDTPCCTSLLTFFVL